MQDKNSFVSFRVPFVGGNNNIIQKKRVKGESKEAKFIFLLGFMRPKTLAFSSKKMAKFTFPNAALFSTGTFLLITASKTIMYFHIMTISRHLTKTLHKV